VLLENKSFFEALTTLQSCAVVTYVSWQPVASILRGGAFLHGIISRNMSRSSAQ